MAKLNHLETVRALIDDLDGIAFGKIPQTLDEMARHCDKALVDHDELIGTLTRIANRVDMEADADGLRGQLFQIGAAARKAINAATAIQITSDGRTTADPESREASSVNGGK